MIPLRAPRRVLVICIRRLGDVLLSTALIRSLKQAWPNAQIDVLVNASAAVTLHGNPDITELVVQPEKPSFGDYWKLARQIFRRYDLALCCMHNDRVHVYGFLASNCRASIAIFSEGRLGEKLKRALSTVAVPLDATVHTVEQYLRLVDRLNLPRIPSVVPPQPVSLEALDRLLGADWSHRAYAVLHPTPMYAYKAWTQQGWLQLAQHLIGRGLHVCLSGGHSAHEREQIDALAALLPEHKVSNLCGQLRFAELTPLIKRAQLYAGPDTSITHLAAATGTSTIALFGPTNPMTWGPWPQGFSGRGPGPWKSLSPLQHEGNVWIVQGIHPCVPCLKEGCDNHLGSRADCLAQLPAARVIALADQILDAR